jgi:AcrR family transcriptional regulator
MKTKSLEDITISKLVEIAGVSRNSFYRNYQSVEDILRQYLIAGTSKWWDAFILVPERYPNVIREMFQHFLDMREDIELIYKANRSYLLMEHIVNCGQLSLTGELSNAYQTAFMSGGLWGIINEWVKRGMKETPLEMEMIFQNQRQQND